MDKQSSLRDLFYTFIDKYGEIYESVRENHDLKNPFKQIITKKIPNMLVDKVPISNEYIVEGSCGKGSWTLVPWIAVFDGRITDTARRGVYIVYLLNRIEKKLYLTLNQGATELALGSRGNESIGFSSVARGKSEKISAMLRERAEEIRSKINGRGFTANGKINTGSEYYDSGVIYYKVYELQSLPEDYQLVADLSTMISVYQDYVSSVTHDEWFPSKTEYDPGLSKELWVDYLNNHLISNTSGLSALAALYAIGGSATMRELEEQYGRTPDFYRNVLGSISEKAVEYFGIAACNQKNAKTWPCMFFGRSVGKDRLGSFEWKIRPELFDALTEINIMQYLEPKQPSSVPFVLPDSFSAPVSRRFVNSLLAKPFVILTGNSGTGKTRIATRFAKYMGVQLEDGKNYELVSVGADWTDNTAILGYFNPMGNDGAGKYVDTAILRLFVRAKKHPEYPFFLILDEMNLSHVERYFADFLSHMETPETAFKIENYSEEEFTYPDNLFVIGTVNIDETTYMFSPKVLDRANVIEFKPDKESIFGMFAKQDFDDSIDTADDETIQAFMSLARKTRENGYEKDLTGEADAFRQIYDILEENGFEFAYRTVKEICRYIYAANEIADAFGYNMNSTVDEQIVQKLLPKIYGNRRAIGDMLEKLAKLLEEKQYNLSLTKVRQMQRKLDNTQYVSFI